MSGVILISALAIQCAVLVAVFFKLSDRGDEETGFGHFALQILFLGFIVASLVLAGKAAYDYKDNCDWLVNSSNTVGASTSYTYEYTCNTNTSKTALTFYDMSVWIMRITILYLFLFFSYKVFMWFKVQKRGKE